MSFLRSLLGQKADPKTVYCSCGRFWFPLVGESHYQDELRRQSRGATDGETILIRIEAEPSNNYDPFAVVAKSVSGRTLGHFAREEARVAQPAIVAFSRQFGVPLCRGRLFSGGPTGNIGVWLDIDFGPFGLPMPNRPAAETGEATSSGTRTGWSLAVSKDFEDDSYDLSWQARLPDDRLRRIQALKAELQRNTELVSRHYLYAMLETDLYRARDAFSSALSDYDAVCVEHDREMDQIRACLLEKFGFIPFLETYRQQTIRHQKDKNFELAQWWTQRGLELYGADAASEEWAQDLRDRSAKLASKLSRKTPAESHS